MTFQISSRSRMSSHTNVETCAWCSTVIPRTIHREIDKNLYRPFPVVYTNTDELLCHYCSGFFCGVAFGRPTCLELDAFKKKCWNEREKKGLPCFLENYLYTEQDEWQPWPMKEEDETAKQ